MKNMKICIATELKKIKDYLSSKINLPVEIVPNYNEGNKVSIKCMYDDNGKKKKAEYSFYILYDENKDNYANAPYLLHCDFWYGDGGSGYADKYESLHDFVKTRMLEEIINKYGKVGSLKEIEDNNTKYEEVSLFDLDDEEEDDPVDEDDDLDIFNEEINVSSDNMQLSMFDEIDDTNNNVDLKDLMSYGIDDYYKKHFSTGTPLLSTIQEELNKLAKYKEYYKKLGVYLQKHIKLLNVCDAYNINKSDKCMYYITNDDGKNIIRVKGNRQDKPIYCLSMVQKGLLD